MEAPRSIDQATFQPTMAPAAIMIALISKDIVHFARATPLIVPGNGNELGMKASLPPSRKNAVKAPKAAASPSDRALSTASLPVECRLRSVSAAAIPLGNLSCSTLIICRFIGTAMKTPSTARKNVHAASTGQGIC